MAACSTSGKSLREEKILRWCSTGPAAVTIDAAQEAPRSAFFELRYYRMRNSRTNMVQRTTGFLSKGYVPAARRAGIAPIGSVRRDDRPEAPFLLVLTSAFDLRMYEPDNEILRPEAGSEIR